MAFTFRGIGTMNYGQREFRPDGSYITTLWFVCFYVPIVPIHSKRIAPSKETKFYGMRSSRTYFLYEKTKPHKAQVFAVYGFFAGVLFFFITAKVMESWWIAIPGILLLGLPWLLRKRALDRMKAESERRELGLTPSGAE
jgi:hypothetical protein